MGSFKRLERAFTDAPRLPLSAKSRYVLFGDCHRGNGTSNDNFLKNQNLYFAALRYYYEQGYTYIELGDGDELWENRSMSPIVEVHDNTFWLLSKYAESGRLYMLYGNHDIVKKNPGFAKKYCSSFRLSGGRKPAPLLSDIRFHQGLILEDDDRERGEDLYLIHGHQADPLNSTFWRLSRFLVRYLWKPAEHFGVLDPTSAAKNNTVKDRTEETLTRYALQKNILLVAGHTHRPMMGSEFSPYYNVGSCVHPRCITCMEIYRKNLVLVKWTLGTRRDRTLFVAREVLAGPTPLNGEGPIM